MLSTVVVMETAFPSASTITMCEVPPGSRVASGARGPAPLGFPALGPGPGALSAGIWAARALR